jgi:hypothetical protein
VEDDDRNVWRRRSGFLALEPGAGGAHRIREALEQTGRNVSGAARLLGTERNVRSQ